MTLRTEARRCHDCRISRSPRLSPTSDNHPEQSCRFGFLRFHATALSCQVKYVVANAGSVQNERKVVSLLRSLESHIRRFDIHPPQEFDHHTNRNVFPIGDHEYDQQPTSEAPQCSPKRFKTNNDIHGPAFVPHGSGSCTDGC
jgi:hypothetical protein